MTKLKLGPVHDGNSVRLTVDLPADMHRDLRDQGNLTTSSAKEIKSICPVFLSPVLSFHLTL